MWVPGMARRGPLALRGQAARVIRTGVISSGWPSGRVRTSGTSPVRVDTSTSENGGYLAPGTPQPSGRLIRPMAWIAGRAGGYALPESGGRSG